MGLSNTQYRDIMYKYDQLRLKNKRIVAARYEKLFNKIPKLKEIQNEIINLSTNQARMELLSPDEKLDEQTYREKKSQLVSKKIELLTKNGYPADYLSPIYSCKDCMDTGYIDNKPCHCLKQYEINSLYANSNLSDILEKENFNTFIALMKSSPEKLLTINGFGVVMMNSMAKWWHENSLWVYDLSKEFTFEKSKSVSNETSNTLQGKTFVVTGSVNHYKNRDELKTDIVAHGGTVVGSVSSKTNYLINNDINSTSSKNKKAKSLNIPIITENEFIKMLHNS